MAGFSQYLQQKVLDHIVGKTSFTMPTAYVALLTAAPSTDASAPTEATYTSYARKITAGADWNAATAATPSVTTNAQAITFVTCTGGSSTVTHFSLMDALTAGNMLGWGALSSSLAVSNNIQPNFAIGTLTLTLD